MIYQVTVKKNLMKRERERDIYIYKIKKKRAKCNRSLLLYILVVDPRDIWEYIINLKYAIMYNLFSKNY